MIADLRTQRRHVIAGGIGAACALFVCVGALGPWAETPVISFDGWAGLGFPLVVVAFLLFVLQILHAFVPRRLWLVLSALMAGFCVSCAIALAILESLLAHAGSALSLVIARGAHRELFGSGHPVTLGWGIPVMGIAAGLLMINSVIGLIGRYAPATPTSVPAGAGVAARPSGTLPPGRTVMDLEDESTWFTTR